MAKTTPTFTVTFNVDGGSSIPNQYVPISNGTATRPSDPTKSGYGFDGWYSDNGFVTLFDFTTIITENITIYAKWVLANPATLASQVLRAAYVIFNFTVDAPRTLGFLVTASGAASPTREDAEKIAKTF